MSEPWLGLHNPERHEAGYDEPQAAKCDDGDWCTPLRPCYCCMDAEVQALRAQVQAVRDVLADYVPFPDSLTMEVLRALDGDDDD